MAYSGGDNDTLVVDVSAMDIIDFQPAGHIAVIGAGVRQYELVSRLWQGDERFTYLVPGGTCASVGVSGLVFGAGIGMSSRLVLRALRVLFFCCLSFMFFCRALGVTSDRIIGVEMVTAAGEVLVINNENNGDLLWAMKGANHGDFGIVTKITLAVCPMNRTGTPSAAELSPPFVCAKPLPNTMLTRVSISMPLSANTVDLWQNWAPHTDDRVGSTLAFYRTEIEVRALFFGPRTLAQPLVQPFIDAGGQVEAMTEMSYLQSVQLYAGCSDETSCQALARPAYPLPPAGTFSLFSLSFVLLLVCRLVYSRYVVPCFAGQCRHFKSLYMFRPLSKPTLAAYVARIAAWYNCTDTDCSDMMAVLLWDAGGGAISRVEPHASAFFHRKFQFHAELAGGYSCAKPEHAALAASFTRDLHTILRAEATVDTTTSRIASYRNYVDADVLLEAKQTNQDFMDVYFGDNAQRLRDIKAEIDPDNVFSYAMSIPPTQASDSGTVCGLFRFACSWPSFVGVLFVVIILCCLQMIAQLLPSLLSVQWSLPSSWPG